MNDDHSEKKKSGSIVDIHSNRSNKKGLAGMLETILRTYRGAAFASVTAFIFFFVLFIGGLACVPAVAFYQLVQDISANWPGIWKTVATGVSLPFCYFAYGISVIFLAPLANKLNIFGIKPFRGNWFSLQSIPWYYHNALTYLVRFTFLDLVTPSPLNVLFFRMMGMKIGKGVMINTSYISDPALITLEDHVTIGGSATLFAHYGQKGILIIAPVTIKRGATIGLKASIMGDVVIGENIIVPPHEVILPKSRLVDANTVRKKDVTG